LPNREYNHRAVPFSGGSEWRKWDLHVHTPASHAAHYGHDAQAWTRYLEALRSLPGEIHVVGINDYIWVDGYEKVRAAHMAGDLPNIDAVFPVIELRLNEFVGTEGKLSRINAHVIFDAGTEPDVINTYFISRLVADFKLSDQYQHLPKRWSSIPTPESLAQLGRDIKSTVPAAELPYFQGDFIEGFNNWVIPFDRVTNALDSSNFPEQPLLGLGKTEWEDIPWGNNTIASKKHLVSSVQLLFTSSPTPAACTASVAHNRLAKVNHRVLDCSDAHNFADSTDKDRLGNCFTWICADPTLAGLKHALIEYEARVFIGEQPPLLTRRASDPTHFISHVAIHPTDPAARPAPSFDVDIPLNSGFIAIVGRKGSGKSALMDSIALAGNSRSEQHFTFLSNARFRNPRNEKASHYQVALRLANDFALGPVPLSSPVDRNEPEVLRYLPQTLLETLCNTEPGSLDEAFEHELRSIIFSHVPDHQRLGCTSLEELVQRRADPFDHEVAQLRADLGACNRSIAELEERSRPTLITRLRANLAAIDQQLANHDLSRPADPVEPTSVSDGASLEASVRLQSLGEELARLDADQAAYEAEYGVARSRLDACESVVREIGVLRSTFGSFATRVGPALALLELDITGVARLQIETGAIDKVHAEASKRVTELDQQLAPDGQVAASRLRLRQEKVELERALDQPRRLYQQQLRELEAWTAVRAKLVGTPADEGTQAYLAGQLSEAAALPARLTDLRERRLAISKKIHEALMARSVLYRELYGPVQHFLDGIDLAKTQFSLEFEAGLEIGDFTQHFLDNIDRSVSGSFYGIDQSRHRIQERVRATDPREWASVSAFLEQHDRDLRMDRRESGLGTALDSASDALRKGIRITDVYDYPFGLSYLAAQYELRSKGRPISELSPGEKGTILLMFYLLVDQSGRPIALDQPDENLDSETIHALLRPAIRAAKATRQILVVTHSPNLAVVGDADQVIVASCDGESFSYESGSIENPTIRDLVVRVLEGTWPAFQNREDKYLISARTDVQEELDI
jgi:ABC-type lipoprotein export system ATPase subunit